MGNKFNMTPGVEAVLAQLYDEERLGPICNLLRAYHYDEDAKLLLTLDMELDEAKQRPLVFYVGRNDNSIPVQQFATIKEAEAQIAEYEKTDPDGVHAGEYYIDAPEGFK